jgi:hypothetical protein
MNEAETRAEHIDPALKAAGWRGASAGCASGMAAALREWASTTSFRARQNWCFL